MDFKKALSEFIGKHSSLSIIVIYNFFIGVVALVFYPIIPVLLGYEPELVQYSSRIGVDYTLQYLIVIVLATISGTIFLALSLRGVTKWKNLSCEKDEDFSKISLLRRKCINLPYLVFLLQILLFSLPFIVLAAIITITTKSPAINTIKLFVVIFSFLSLAAVLSHTFSSSIFKKILFRTYKNQGVEGTRIGLQLKIFLQIIPMLMVAILFTSAMGYSRLMEEKGEQVYNLCKTYLETKIPNIQSQADKNSTLDSKEVFRELGNFSIPQTNVKYFLKTPNGKLEKSQSFEPGLYFSYFIEHPMRDGSRVFGDNNEVQGIIKTIKTKNGDYKVGIRIELNSSNSFLYFVFGFLVLLGINCIVIYFFSKSFVSEISLVADGLNEIASGEAVDLDKKIAVSSNDEIADLVIAFNNIQEKEKEHLKLIQSNMTAMMDQERLASLGQLIAGISHNLRTPIMALAGAIHAIKDLVSEYNSSIDDAEVTPEDHKEIAQEMNNWLDKMKPYCSYMSDIINAVKDQTVIPSSHSLINFTIEKVIGRILMFTEQELRKRKCKIVTEVLLDKNTKINGDISMLIQVLNNLVVNATDAYGDSEGIVKITISKDVNNIIFAVNDEGSGIREEVKDKLFKEMVTSKGTDGIGLGLFISNSTIKARFKGKMWFESEFGKGSTFYISIPVALENDTNS